MARTLSAAMRERARFVGDYMRAHRGERPIAELMRDAQAAFRRAHAPMRMNPSGGKTLLVLGGLALVGWWGWNALKAAQTPPPPNPYEQPLYPTGAIPENSPTGETPENSPT